MSRCRVVVESRIQDQDRAAAFIVMCATTVLHCALVVLLPFENFSRKTQPDCKGKMISNKGRCVILLAHSAGTHKNHPNMLRWKTLCSKLGEVLLLLLAGLEPHL